MALAPSAAFAASCSAGVYSLGIAVRVGGQTRELRAADDLEEDYWYSPAVLGSHVRSTA